MPNNSRMSGASKASASDPGTGAIAIDYSAADQVLTTPGRGLHINADGTLVLILIDDAHAGLPYVVKAGVTYPFAVKTIVRTGSSGATGNILL